MKYISNLTLFGVSLILFYSISQIFKFYSVSEDVYGYYFFFYAFIILSIMILPERAGTTI